MKKEDRPLKMRSVYDTGDGQTFEDMQEAQAHQAELDILAALEGSGLDPKVLLPWIKSNKEAVSHYVYPHNVEIDRQN